MTEKLTTITWQDPNHIVRPSWVEATRIALKQDMQKYKKDESGKGSYHFGISVMKMARLVLIAEYLNEPKLAQEGRDWLKKEIEPWLSNTNSNKLYYDTTNGGIITDLSMPGAIENAINKRYDNHHHNYGYVVYAAAVLDRKSVV